jgi:hydroxymethylbilane synthase
MSDRAERKIRIATRGSKLALWQANHVRTVLEETHPGLEVGLLRIKTTGDKILDVPLAKVGGKGLFVKEIEEALLDGRADLAVHSMKDVPVVLPPELELAATGEREDVRDALVTASAEGWASLPRGGRVGTSSLRRQAQLLHLRPDLEIVSIRGNLDTRLRKLRDEKLDAVVVAAAGIKRLGLEEHVTEYLSVTLCLPAVCQGALALEIRRDDSLLRRLLQPFRHHATEVAVRAERAFLARLEGGCQVPIAGLADVNGGRLKMKGLVASVDGGKIITEKGEGPEEEAARIGKELAESLLDRGGREILQEVYGATPSEDKGS